MALIKYSDAEILSVLDSEEDDLICHSCGGMMKKEGILYICNDCERKSYWIRRDDEQSADN